MNQYQKETLLTNLEALKTHHPLLEERIRYPIDHSHIAFDKNHQPSYYHHTGWFHFETHSERIEKDLAITAEEWFLFGIGNGEYITALLNNTSASIAAWERDPALYRFVLMQHDFSEPLTSGRLTLLLGCDLFSKGITPTSYQSTLYHPFFSQIYTHEKSYLDTYSEKCTDLAVFGLGGLFVDDLAEALRNIGFTVWPIDLARWSIEELSHTITSLNPRFLASINYRNGTSEFCQSLNLPYICWEIDPNMDLDVTTKDNSSLSHIFTYRMKNIEAYKNGGFINVHHLPLATNPNKRKKAAEFKPGTPSPKPYPVSYIGMSMVENSQTYKNYFIQLYCKYKQQESAEQECISFVEMILQNQRENWNSYTIPDIFPEYFSDFSLFLQDNKVKVDPVKIIAQLSASERRLHYVSSLGQHGIHVWGDKGWESIVQSGARYNGYAGHNKEVTDIYNKTLVNIDIGRLYQLDIIPMRVFDVLSCGGFLIAEYSEELEGLFSLGTHLESYSNIEELIDKTVFYTDNSDLASKIGLAGREEVIKKHTIQGRTQHMLDLSGLSLETKKS